MCEKHANNLKFQSDYLNVFNNQIDFQKNLFFERNKIKHMKLKMKMIMSYSEKISNKLNELLEKNYDAEKGYINAAENVNSTDLKVYFQNRASERSEFAKELRTEILRYGEDPKDSGTFSGSMHRSWMNLKSVFSSNNNEAILEETIKGEKASLEEYNEILSERTLPPSIDSILLKQKNAIQAAINTQKVHEELVS